MCGNYKCLCFRVPKGKQPVGYFIEECSELPDFCSIQFLEQFLVLLAFLYSTDIIANLLPCLFLEWTEGNYLLPQTISGEILVSLPILLSFVLTLQS